MKYFFSMLLPMLVACKTFNNKLPLTQGIKGTVVEQSGNMMPRPGREKPKPKAISATLYVYESTTVAQTQGSLPSFTRINSKLVTILKTNSYGVYATYLPEGTYSVFIKDDKGFFASESDGNGIINPITVSKGQVTEHNWVLSRNAVY
ncbi:hypothetical protein [Mucilaginibacter ginkgonis]|uniref:Carboxypeptidase regulatory-like domain-containing protein n=1 Tax=Mucilaginibacter ginkgonis TaxID=2682091 RepID=A0A6I4HVF2_9SPHI|nr:hypothetical protein [Mucilaginibacter ginkgonis]QQL50089.1 hypothetical protein GO620_001150 [Mucilaginibacter ginkgonis]